MAPSAKKNAKAPPGTMSISNFFQPAPSQSTSSKDLRNGNTKTSQPKSTAPQATSQDVIMVGNSDEEPPMKMKKPVASAKPPKSALLSSSDEDISQNKYNSTAANKSTTIATTSGSAKPQARASLPAAMDIDSDDETAPSATKKRKKPTMVVSSSDEDEDDKISPPPKKKTAVSGSSASKPKARVSLPAKTRKAVVSSDEDEPIVPKAKAKARTSLQAKKRKADDDFIVSSDEDKPVVAKVKGKAKAPAKKAGNKEKDDAEHEPEGKGKGKGKPEESKKPNWAAMQAARARGPTAPGTKTVPDGEENCLAGLALVFTGELSSFSRDEAVDIAKRFGGRVVGQPSSKTDFVVLGEGAGPKKIEAIAKHGLKTINEDEFLELIATRKGNGKGLDEKTKKKMAKEQEAIKAAAKEMDKKEKEAIKDSQSGTNPSKVIDPSAQLWTTRYAPQSLKDVCGNKSAVDKLQLWLNDWAQSYKAEFKKPGKNGMNMYRAVLISGSPGIGKTTSAHLCAKLAGYTPIELNASDTRSKKLVENGMNINNKSLDGFFSGGTSNHSSDTIITDRTCLIMDEVDGMSAGDRGGVGALNALIKKSKIPIICIANDKGAQKLKPLMSTTYGLSFAKPQASTIRSRILSIVYKEKMKIPANVIDQLIAGAQSDIRQVLNMLSTVKLMHNTLSFDEGKELSKMNEKYSIMSPFDLTSKILGPYLFSHTARETLGEKMELYFQDHSFIPLFIQENYLKTQPAKLRNEDGPDKDMKLLRLMDQAASSISDGDLVDAMIHGPEQHWALMPLHAVCSTVRPASFLYGTGAHYGGPNSISFPKWLGQNSSQNKLNRQLNEVQVRMRLKVSGDKNEIRQSYIPALYPHIIQPLMNQGANAVDNIIERMDDYYLSKEDWDAIVELGVGDKDYETVLKKKISAPAKAALTRKYNASEHPIPFYKATDLGKAPKKLVADQVPDHEDAFELDEIVEDVSDDEKNTKDSEDISNDKLIKASKKKATGKAKK